MDIGGTATYFILSVFAARARAVLVLGVVWCLQCLSLVFSSCLNWLAEGLGQQAPSYSKQGQMAARR